MPDNINMKTICCYLGLLTIGVIFNNFCWTRQWEQLIDATGLVNIMYWLL